LPQLAELPVRLIVNVMGSTREDVARLVGAFTERDEVSAIELNVSCPNVKTGLIMGADPNELAALLDAVRPISEKPLIVKLTPNCASPADVAAAAEQHGADAVSLINTLRGMAMHPEAPGRLWLGGGTGGVSGPAVRAVALAQVREVRGRVDLPIVGMGGVQSGRHADDLRHAGADLVAVGTESFRDPLAARRIADEMSTFTEGFPAYGFTSTRGRGEFVPLGLSRPETDVDSPPMPPATKTPIKPSVAAPERSLVQRMEALQRANEIRTRRAQLKRDLKGGRVSIHDLLLEPPEYVETAKVFDMLLAVPKYGRVKVNKVLQQCRISPSKTIGGLSQRQRTELVSMLRR
jgi:dihydroorotate dehydrogenase (NAD+) catalytic subunit